MLHRSVHHMWPGWALKPRGVARNLEKGGGGKEMSKFVVMPTVSSRLLLHETIATRTNCIER